MGRHCEKRRGTGPEYRVEPTVKVDEFDEISSLKTDDLGLGTWMSILVFVLSSALAGFLIYAVVLYKRVISQRNAPPIQDDTNKHEVKIRVHPYGANDDISPLEMN